MEHMRNAECIYYSHDKNLLHTVHTPHIYTVPVTYVNGSSFDWSWYPSSYGNIAIIIITITAIITIISNTIFFVLPITLKYTNAYTVCSIGISTKK